jgi:cell division initiation protein
MLRPSDIEQKTFSTALRGYDLNEVDDFLDEIIATIRDLEEQLASRPAKQPGGKHDPVHDESAVGRALIAAQAAADRLVEEAREEADRIRAEARTDADNWVSERDASRAEAEQEMAELTNRVATVRRELASLATSVADSLDLMDAAIESASLQVPHVGIHASEGDEQPVNELVEEVVEVTEEVEIEVVDAVFEDNDEAGLDDYELADSEESWDSEDSPDDDEELADEDD